MPAAQQDVAPTLAAALGVHMPPTWTGRVLPCPETGMEPRVVVVIVLDGMRRDYFDRYATLMPMLAKLRQRQDCSLGRSSISFRRIPRWASTIATGTDPPYRGNR